MNDSIKKIMIITILSFMFVSVDVKASYESLIQQYAPYAQAGMNSHGVYASLSLAQAIQEQSLKRPNWNVINFADSKTGNLKYKEIKGNNMFGIKEKLKGMNTYPLDTDLETLKKANDECNANNGVFARTTEEINGSKVKRIACFKEYNSIEDSFKDHAKWLKETYKNRNEFAAATDLMGQLKALNIYATDSKYVCKLIQHINNYDLTRFDPTPSGKLSTDGCENVGGGSSSNGADLEHFGTTYTGDITKGWIYERFEFSETFDNQLSKDRAEENIDDIIDVIFDRAKTVYFSILSDISGLIGSIDAGPFSSWLQCNSNWGSISLGSSSETICSAGCAATSVAIQIARSGVPLSLNGNLNPGSFVSVLNQNGGFTSGGDIYWAKASLVAPSFQFNNLVGLSGKDDVKISKIANYLSSGKNYIVAHVNGSKNGTTSNHWVAITGVTSTDVMMIDPSGRGTSLNSAYGVGNLDVMAVYTVK